uniref:Uncharacterized protein n=1 Tax=Strigamia maritima TaxID=126957 RepID=T1J646_STRMM
MAASNSHCSVIHNGKFQESLLEAIRHNDCDLVLQMLEKADVRSKDQCNVTALHLAVENGHLECVRLLLESGADSNAATISNSYIPSWQLYRPSGTTPLHLAAKDSKENNLECAKELIRNGADYNAVDILSRTCLHVAAEKGLMDFELELSKILGLSIAQKPKIDDIKAIATMKDLVLDDYDTDVNVTDHLGFSCFHYVCFDDDKHMRRRPEAAVFLLVFGSNPNIKNHQGISLLESELRRLEDRIILEVLVEVLPVLPLFNLTRFQYWHEILPRNRWSGFRGFNSIVPAQPALLHDWYRVLCCIFVEYQFDKRWDVDG